MYNIDRRRQIWLSFIKAKAGTYYEWLIESPQNVATLWTHPSADVRTAAIMAGYAIWNLDANPLFIEDCLAVLKLDIDEFPKHCVVGILSLVFNATKDRSIQIALVNVMKDLNVTVSLRNDAYRAVREIEEGTSRQTRAEVFDEARNFRLGITTKAASIDWAFIDGICQGAENGQKPFE